ncbi:MAG: hypothetical protein WEB57_08220 [Pseudohongiellaceae bacterium]
MNAHIPLPDHRPPSIQDAYDAYQVFMRLRHEFHDKTRPQQEAALRDMERHIDTIGNYLTATYVATFY